MKTRGNSLKGKRRVTFSIMAPRAKEVSLAGDFNQWRKDAHPMKMGEHGQWTRTLFVAPGEYQYKFVVDGAWKTDEKNPEKRRNCFGTRNNIIKVTSK